MRFYVPPESIFPEKNIIKINDETEVHHIRDVMRLVRGDKITIFNGRDAEYTGEIKEMQKKSVIIEIKGSTRLKKEVPFNIVLYQAVPKKSKMDFIIEKAVELGASSIVPITTERTIPVFNSGDCSNRRRMERWKKIIKTAAKQCGRFSLPAISDVMDFDRALIESKKADLSILAAVDSEAGYLKDILRASMPKNISVFIGPEGDFSKDEIVMAKKQGLKICSLGRLILRVETAAIYVLSCLNYELA